MTVVWNVYTGQNHFKILRSKITFCKCKGNLWQIQLLHKGKNIHSSLQLAAA